MRDAVEAKLTSFGGTASGGRRFTFVVEKDDRAKVDVLIDKIGFVFGLAFAEIDTDGMPVAASGISPLDGLNHKRGPAALAPRLPTTADGGSLLDNDNSALGPHGSSPARKPSQEAFLLCNQPRGRVYLEQRRRHAIPAANHINNTDEAKHVLRAWLDVESLSELDRDTAAADRWKKVEADYKTWLTAARYVEG